MEDLTDLLQRLYEYMDNKADTEDGPNGWPVPNEEMSFCVEIQWELNNLQTKSK